MPAASIPISKPLIGADEREAVLRVLESGNLVQGSVVAELENGFRAVTGAPYALAVSSGTAGLHLALIGHGIGPGDEVVTSPFSFIATANAILMTGATPVFADIEESTYNLSPDALEAVVTARTRAVIPVHLYGRICRMDRIEKIATKAGAVIIEDAAQALGADSEGRPPGSSNTAVFSLYATKNVTSAEGGVVTTHDPEVADRLRLLRNHGMRERYRYEILGYNFRMTDLQAALAVPQLKRLTELTGARRLNAGLLSAGLRGVEVPEAVPGHAWHQYTVRMKDRDRAARRLAEAGVGTGIFYPLGLHQVPHIAAASRRGPLTVTERVTEEVLSLPVHPALSASDLDCVIELVNAL